MDVLFFVALTFSGIFKQRSEAEKMKQWKDAEGNEKYTRQMNEADDICEHAQSHSIFNAFFSRIKEQEVIKSLAFIKRQRLQEIVLFYEMSHVLCLTHVIGYCMLKYYDLEFYFLALYRNLVVKILNICLFMFQILSSQWL